MTPAARAPAASAARERVERARARALPIAAEYGFEPRFLSHEGVWQHYVDEGPRDLPPLLFVHGNPTWSFAWRRLVRAFSPRWRCVAPDHVGCGLSDKPALYPYRLAQHVLNLERLVLALDLRRITLVLHDWGGPIGMGFARRQPGRVARLVITNSAAFRSTRMPARVAAGRLPVVGPLAIRGLNAFARGAASMAVARPLSREVRRGYLLPYRSWSERVALQAFVADIPMRPEHPSWDELVATEESLARWRDVPARIVWGERDWCFTPAFRARWQEALPQAKAYRLAGAGHYLFEDAAEELRDKIADFLEQSGP